MESIEENQQGAYHGALLLGKTLVGLFCHNNIKNLTAFLYYLYTVKPQYVINRQDFPKYFNTY
jgi:hypothetical protein